ncbi:MAG: DUF1801 domain-containing protein [Bacteroidetes bacterium]|nr:DUF1801 domain-containing protein [Bacteroidota bacterium]MBS1974306.1 DUF1801 domain-containing protein [Bacteroidota bacterium]
MIHLKPNATIDDYIKNFPEEIQTVLEKMRAIIKEAAPADAGEAISYGMPAFKYHGMLVFFSANKNHIGFYPTPSPIVFFKKELAAYKTSKGAIQFPLGKAIPVALVRRIVKFKAKENLEKEMAAKKKKTRK